MGYVRSRKFCCCLPVRLGVFIMTILSLGFGSAVAGVLWYGVLHPEKSKLAGSDKTMAIVTAVVWTLLAVVSLFGLIGAIIKQKACITVYAWLLWIHVILSIATGSYYIYTLFHSAEDDSIKKCEGDNASDLEHGACKAAFDVGRGILIAVYIIMWLIEMWVASIASDYVGQLNEEEAASWLPAQNAFGSAAPVSGAATMATTYNYGAPYAFSAPDNSHSGVHEKANDSYV
ncbi:hypothetical protein EVG20_g5368 [Dentipellis fragilis]|uniref:Uncharacterized protein n=1 Tax=Dentipellis fragilis TaxID=205917 RepID=A0A4Y9YVG8_9AGAM|nr:hypothetical protein EVG20_g5368 [Dentipellis fragilis]